ncbi:transcriptional regulator [Rivularia sp. PCC 7116]|uniref:TetR/AcrR family transcriptional regulator n=1 Tax=Rivularia sp. PCC 7116 TaxID=373994 RepID=UPI00029F233B|nr:TetR/AcrR family transcriptional regulator [Rivularia sp. PCC 7116]AFY58815.1 transcriptional regulator [Rivularia sp. PCC 7116]
MQARKKDIKASENGNADTSQSGEKVEAILQGAMQEFLTHGFAGTTMDKVTAAAGVSKTTVYSYFQDKEKLFIALIERLISTCGVALNQPNPQIFEGEPADVLSNFANNLLNQFSKNISDVPEFLDLMRLMIAESGRFPMLAQYMVRHIDNNVVRVITNYLSSRSELQITDPKATTRVFLGALVHYTMIEYMLQAGDIMPMERERLIKCLVNLIVPEQKNEENKYARIKEKSSRRKRSSSGKFEQDYQEPKQVRSLRLTDTAWENLDKIARDNNLTRSELVECLARGEKFE